MTRRRVVALDQSLLSSRHRMMYSGVCIFWRTMCSTCCDATCSSLFLLPGAAEINPVPRLGRVTLAACLRKPGAAEASCRLACGICMLLREGYAHQGYR